VRGQQNLLQWMNEELNKTRRKGMPISTVLQREVPIRPLTDPQPEAMQLNTKVEMGVGMLTPVLILAMESPINSTMMMKRKHRPSKTTAIKTLAGMQVWRSQMTYLTMRMN
jgi:hypothetical protein